MSILMDSGQMSDFYVETNNGDTCVLVSSGTFECPVEDDGTLLLSTLQAQIPHANGLHIGGSSSDRRKAIRFDKRTGKFYPPGEGWGHRLYTVSFANVSTYGCFRAPLAIDRYDRATTKFKESVDAVERLFDIGYETEKGDNQSIEKLSKEIARLRSRNRDLEAEKRRLEIDLDEKDKKILSLISEVPGPEYNPGETDVANEFGRMIKEKDTELARIRIENEKLQRQVEALQSAGTAKFEEFIDTKQPSIDTIVPEKYQDLQVHAKWLMQQLDEKTRKMVELEMELQRKSHAIIEMEQSKTSLEQELHTTATDVQRAEELLRRDVAVAEVIRNSEREDTEATIDELHQQLMRAQEANQTLREQLELLQARKQQLEREVQEITQSYLDTKWRVGELENELHEKESELANLKEIRKLYDDVKRRNGELEAIVNAKNAELASMQEIRKTLDEVKWRNGEFENILIQKNDQLAEYQERQKTFDDIQWKNGELETALNWKNQELIVLEQKQREANDALQNALLQLEQSKQKYQELEAEYKNRSVDYQEKEDWRWRVYELEASVARTESDIQAFSEDNQGLKEKNYSLECELKSLQEKSQEEIRNLQDELKSAHAHEHQLDRQLKEITELYNETKWRNGELEAALNQKNEIVQEIQKMLDDSKWRIGELEAELHEKRSVVANYHELAQLYDEIKRINGGLEAALNERTAELAKLKRKDGELETALNEKSIKLMGLEEMREMLDDAERRIGELEASLIEKNLELAALQDVRRLLDEARWMNDQLEAELQMKNAELANLQSIQRMFDDAKWRVGELETVLTERNIELAALKDIQQRYDEIKWSNGELEAALNEKNGQLAEFENIRNSLDNEKWSNGELEAALNWKNQELMVLLQQKKDTENAMQNLKDELEEARKKYQLYVDQYRNVVAIEQKENEQLQQAVHEVEVYASSAESDIQNLAEENRKLKERINNLEVKLEESESRPPVVEVKEEIHVKAEIPLQTAEAFMEFSEEEKRLQEELEITKKFLADLEEQLRQRNQAFIELENSKKQLEEKLGTVSESAVHHTQEILQREAASIAEAIKTSEYRSLQAELESVRAHEQQLQRELKEINQFYNDTKWRNGELETAFNEKQAQLAALVEIQQKFDEVQWRNGELEGVINEKNAQLANLQEIQKTLDYFKSRNGELETELDHKNHELIALGQRQSETENALQNLQKELDEFRKKYQDLLEEYRNRTAEQKETENIQQQVHQVEASVALAASGISVLTEENQALKEKYRILKEEFDAIRAHEQELERQINELTQLYNDSKWRNGELEGQVNEKNAELANLQEIRQQLDEFKWRNGELEAALNEKNIKLVDLQEISKMYNDVKWRNGELEAALDQKAYEVVALVQRQKDTDNVVQNLQQQLEAAWKKYQELEESYKNCAIEQTEVVNLQQRIRDFETQVQSLQNGERDLINELQVARNELENYRQRCGELEKAAEQISHVSSEEAKRKMNELYSEIARIQGMYDEARWRVDQMEIEMGEESKKLYDARNRCSELEFQMEQKLGVMRDAEHRVKEMEAILAEMDARNAQQSNAEGESMIKGYFDSQALLDQLNEVRNTNAWLDSQVAHYKHLFDNANLKLNELKGTLDGCHRYLWDAFVIRKEPFVNRDKSKLSMWYEGTQEAYPRVWYELDAPNAKEVYLSASYYNWECLVLMTWHEHGKWGVWVDVPRGRHEFKFLVDGKWATSNEYPDCGDNIGGTNNWRHVD